MKLAPSIRALQAELAALAGLGDEATARAAERLSTALGSAIGLRLLDILAEAVLELDAQLPDGHVEVRLAGQDPHLVYVPDQVEAQAAPADEALSARVTLRLPEGLKASIEVAASREGLSANSWIVRALARSFTGGGSRAGNRLSGFAKS